MAVISDSDGCVDMKEWFGTFTSMSALSRNIIVDTLAISIL